MKRQYSSCSDFNFTLGSKLAHIMSMSIVTGNFIFPDSSPGISPCSSKASKETLVATLCKKWTKSEHRIYSDTSFSKQPQWFFVRNGMDHRARICVPHWTIFCITICTCTTISPSWMNKSCFNSPYLISFYLTAMESKTYTLNYMQLPYQLRFGVLFWYTLEVQQMWTTVCSGRLHNRFISKRSMQPTSGDISICRLCQVDTIPAPVRLRIGTCWGTRLAAFCC